jgi:hypothetical protein
MMENGKRILGCTFIFLGGSVVGALVCVLLWRAHQHAYEMMGALVITLAASLWLIRRGIHLATGHPPRPVAVILGELRGVLAYRNGPARAQVPTWVQLGPIFGALLALWYLIVTTFGDGRPFFQ